MTGRIRSLSAGNGAGLIAGDNGVSAHFLSSAVLEYDVTCLAVGQMVTFDLESGSVPMAVNVCVQRQHRLPLTPGKLHESVPLRYVGFRQAGCLREYKFERIKPGEPTETLVVTVDMALFRKHRVGIQEGPGLCLRALETEPVAAGLQQALTDRHMLAYLASRPAPRPKPRHIPPPRHPAPV
jgi:cold shock CspA family protein